MAAPVAAAAVLKAAGALGWGLPIGTLAGFTFALLALSTAALQVVLLLRLRRPDPWAWRSLAALAGADVAAGSLALLSHPLAPAGSLAAGSRAAGLLPVATLAAGFLAAAVCALALLAHPRSRQFVERRMS